MMNNKFKKCFESLNIEITSNQKRIEINSPIMVFYGISKDAKLRVAFATQNKWPKFESTSLLKVSLVSTDDLHWLNIDLMEKGAANVFYSFCDNLVNSIDGEGDELKAMTNLKKSFDIWRKMFKNSKTKMNVEHYKGLLGELYVMDQYLLKHYDTAKVIKSWTGPEKARKDFSLDQTWIEVKTTEGNAIEISSIEQLSSKNEGLLAVVQLEKMSQVYDEHECLVKYYFDEILQKIGGDLFLQDELIKKILEYGYNLSCEKGEELPKYEISDFMLYNVKDDFPRVKHSDIPFDQILNVRYRLMIKAIEAFKVGDKDG